MLAKLIGMLLIRSIPNVDRDQEKPDVILDYYLGGLPSRQT
jgi:hypothetical protein